MTTKTFMSVDEFEAVCEHLGPCELVRGEVMELSPAGDLHSEIVTNITTLLANWAKRSRLGRVRSGESGIYVESDPDTVRGADAAYVSYQRVPRGKRSRGFSRTPPELVVEVVGERQSWNKVVEKTGEYLAMGVDRVWVVDPDSRKVHIYRSDSEPLIRGENDTLSDEAVLQGFSCRVAEFFEE